MKLYHSHADRLVYHFSDVPAVCVLSLSSSSTLRDACFSFLHHDLSLLASRAAGSKRSHEPYCAIANSSNASLPLSAITRRWANLYVSDLYAKGYSSGTINGIISKYRKLFRWLYSMELVSVNPFLEVNRAPPSSKKRHTRSLTASELSELFSHLDAVKSTSVAPGTYSDMLRLGLLTAMRYNEILTLTPSVLHLDDELPHLVVKESYSKTRKAREVVLSDSAVALLRKYAAGLSADERLFKCSYSALQERLAVISKKTGVSYFFHLTRHTAITEYAAYAESMSELQAFSGHASKQGVEPYANHDLHSLRQRVRAKLQAHA